MKIYPIFFKPVYQDYVWGGDSIYSYFNRKKGPTPCAESWEVSDRKEGESVITNGPYEGYSFSRLIVDFGKELLGRNIEKFPLLIKIIDANNALSFQVHPDDTSAKKMKAEAKTEMWYILDADKDAGIYAGFKRKVGLSEFEKAIADQSFENLMEFHGVEKGDIVFIPGGTVHAIGTGCLILEVQQNSNTTYRIYDWGRDRPLHIKQALEVTHFDTKVELQKEKLQKQVEDNKIFSILNCSYFTMEKLEVNSKLQLNLKGNTPHIFFPIEGSGKVSCPGEEYSFSAGQSFMIPAAASDVEITADKSCELMKIFLP